MGAKSLLEGMQPGNRRDRVMDCRIAGIPCLTLETGAAGIPQRTERADGYPAQGERVARDPLGREIRRPYRTGMGVEHVGTRQSSVTVCRLNELCVNTHVAEVLQRVSQPSRTRRRAHPRLPKQRCAVNRLVSALDALAGISAQAGRPRRM